MTEDKPAGGDLAAVRLASGDPAATHRGGPQPARPGRDDRVHPQYVSLAERPRKDPPSATPAPPLPATLVPLHHIWGNQRDSVPFPPNTADCDTRLPRVHQPSCVVCQCPALSRVGRHLATRPTHTVTVVSHRD